MAKGTKIEWADDTVNAEMGCDGCELWDPKNKVRICYAGLQTERMLSKGPLKGWPPTFDQPKIFPGRIATAARWKDLTGTVRENKPWLNGLPRTIFVNDMVIPSPRRCRSTGSPPSFGSWRPVRTTGSCSRSAPTGSGRS